MRNQLHVHVFDSNDDERHQKEVLFTSRPMQGARPIRMPLTEHEDSSRPGGWLDLVCTLENVHSKHALRADDGRAEIGVAQQWSVNREHVAFWWSVELVRDAALESVYQLRNIESANLLSVHDYDDGVAVRRRQSAQHEACIRWKLTRVQGLKEVVKEVPVERQVQVVERYPVEVPKYVVKEVSRPVI